ncbi:MAG TPA: hypothetical protein P5511_07770 [Candidatus Goldiibacteriota bacterium]|nr:hypothetical protein [Candidatus Goldiibacteriota bacterium]
MDDTITLTIEPKTYEFNKTNLKLDDKIFDNIFAREKKLLREMIEKDKYVKYKPEVISKYAVYLDTPTGIYLNKLKSEGDRFYKNFLHSYGEGPFSKFEITDKNVFWKKGLYAFFLDGGIVYVGRCKDNYRNRFNAGYGNISPRNCYKIGRSTNCRINNLITSNRDKQIELYICPTNDDKEIEASERKLIEKYRPIWNISLNE